MSSLSLLIHSTMSLNAGDAGNDVTDCVGYTLSTQEETPNIFVYL